MGMGMGMVRDQKVLMHKCKVKTLTTITFVEDY